MNKKQLQRVAMILLLLSSHRSVAPVDPISLAGGAALGALATWLGHELLSKESVPQVLATSEKVAQEEQNEHKDVLDVLKSHSGNKLYRMLASQDNCNAHAISNSLDRLRLQEKKLRTLSLSSKQEKLEQQERLHDIEILKKHYMDLHTILSSNHFKAYQRYIQLTVALPHDLDKQSATEAEVLSHARINCSNATYPLSDFVTKLKQWDGQACEIQCNLDKEDFRAAQELRIKRSTLHRWKGMLVGSQDYKTECTARQQADGLERQAHVMQESMRHQLEWNSQLERRRLNIEEERNRLHERQIGARESVVRNLRSNLAKKNAIIDTLHTKLAKKNEQYERELHTLRNKLNDCIRRQAKENYNPAPEGYPPPGPINSEFKSKPSAPPEGPPQAPVS